MRRIFTLIIINLMLLLPAHAQEVTPEATADADAWRQYASIDGEFGFEYPPQFGAAQRADGLIIVANEGIYMEIYPPSLIGDAYDTPEALLNALIQQVEDQITDDAPLLIQIGELDAAAIHYSADDMDGLYATVAVAPQRIAIVDIHPEDAETEFTQSDIDRMFEVVATFKLGEINAEDPVAEATAPVTLSELDELTASGSGGIVDLVLLSEEENRFDELTESFTTSDGLTFDYPADYTVVETVDGSTIISDGDALETSIVLFRANPTNASVLEAILSVPMGDAETMRTGIPVLFNLTEDIPAAIYQFDGPTPGTRIAVQVTPERFITAQIASDTGSLSWENLALNILATVREAESSG